LIPSNFNTPNTGMAAMIPRKPSKAPLPRMRYSPQLA
jgi:hypothetical protein